MTDNQILAEKGETLRTPVVDEASLGFMLKLAGPIVLTTVSFTLLQFVDRIMVSRLGTAALAAVLPAGFTASIPAACVMGVFAGLNFPETRIFRIRRSATKHPVNSNRWNCQKFPDFFVV